MIPLRKFHEEIFYDYGLGSEGLPGGKRDNMPRTHRAWPITAVALALMVHLRRCWEWAWPPSHRALPAQLVITPQPAAARVVAKKAAKATVAATKASSSAQFEVCNVAGASNLDGVSFPFLEGTWSGSFYTSYSLAAEPSPGTCGPKHSTTAGSMINVEEAASLWFTAPRLRPYLRCVKRHHQRIGSRSGLCFRDRQFRG